MKFVKFGVIGTENSHVKQAFKRFNIDKSIKDASVEAIYPGEGDTLEHAGQIKKDGKIALLVDKPEDMFGKVDAVIIMNRHAGYHAKYARLFLENKVPVFVDKPLTCDLKEAEEIIDLSNKNNTWLSSWSTMWQTSSFENFFKQTTEELGPINSGMVGGPFDFESEHGGVFFYGIHTVEMLLNGFGYDIKTINADLSGKNCWVTVTLESGKIVSLHLVGEGSGKFQALVHCEKGSRHLFVDSTDCYDRGFEKILNSIKNNEKPLTDEQLLMPIKVLLAIDKSVRTNQKIKLG